LAIERDETVANISSLIRECLIAKIVVIVFFI